MEHSKLDTSVPTSRQAWEPLTRTYVGNIGDVVQGGGGKLSVTANDSGDINKPKGQG